MFSGRATGNQLRPYVVWFVYVILPILSPKKNPKKNSHLPLSDKINRLSNNTGIPPYQWWSESLHGIALNGPGVTFHGGPIHAATSFPQVILTSSSFNRTLWVSIASAIAIEARAMYNVGQAGLTFWAPTINVFRDPRWGRGQETPGEDPTVVAAYSVAYVSAFQSPPRFDDEGNLMDPEAKERLKSVLLALKAFTLRLRDK